MNYYVPHEHVGYGILHTSCSTQISLGKLYLNIILHFKGKLYSVVVEQNVLCHQHILATGIINM